jgi:hypothetical protein
MISAIEGFVLSNTSSTERIIIYESLGNFYSDLTALRHTNVSIGIREVT